MELTSLDYANLIAWLSSVKHGVLLGKTQLQKLLFIFYGLCLARTNISPFDDDTPKAFPFGPVFPRSYKRYMYHPNEISQSDKDRFMQRPEYLRVAVEVVDKFCMYTATRLSEWSHREGSPWKKTVYQGGNPAWGREIDSNMVKNFFSQENWSVGL